MIGHYLKEILWLYVECGLMCSGCFFLLELFYVYPHMELGLWVALRRAALMTQLKVWGMRRVAVTFWHAIIWPVYWYRYFRVKLPSILDDYLCYLEQHKWRP